ncbi:hypothetical protein HNO88_000861 [Novosphingobium chloroacetimidivorans]|uniref:Uncharacterized protein n=1 Tax=Novosphingobium chloroacetimidivorans TaxID=1428314 RepID=A0A7W7K7U7_9SPHN|nr:hypothetical protein [Novosphingobium chloroacetimidivorans]MBB4857550.1 hypothetical protein [Novosphingobium chloroacetimidivorans]
MTQTIKALEDRTGALAAMAQPVLVALSTAGLTGGAMAVAGMLAGRMMRRG